MNAAEEKEAPNDLVGHSGSDASAAVIAAGPAFREIELKLTGTRRNLAAIFHALGNGPGQTTDVRSTYYDTDDRRLWRRGYTLRLRHRNAEHEITLKSRGEGTLVRGEWSAAVADPIVDLSSLPPEAPRSRIGTILPEELHPLYVTEFTRKEKQVTLAGATVDVALDAGRIVSGDREAPLVELELELARGSVASMLEHLKATLGRRRFIINSRSKSDRGMELADGAAPAILRAGKPALCVDDSIDTALTKMVTANTQQVIGNIAAAVNGRDPEGVHQLRVGLRRLRSSFVLFKGLLTDRAVVIEAAAERGLKALGDARDLDVFLLETVPPVVAAHRDNVALRQLVEAAEDGRAKAYESVRRLVGEQWFNSMLFDLLLTGEQGGLIQPGRDEPLRQLAIKVLQKRHKKALKLGRGFDRLGSSERHRVRIALKKLRYACDDLSGLFPQKRTKPYLKRLAALQDDLGRLNDATVAADLADHLGADDVAATVGAAVIKGWYGHRLQHVEPHMCQAWRLFADTRPFWRS